MSNKLGFFEDLRSWRERTHTEVSQEYLDAVKINNIRLIVWGLCVGIVGFLFGNKIL